jgi:hypothetical protein
MTASGGGGGFHLSIRGGELSPGKHGGEGNILPSFKTQVMNLMILSLPSDTNVSPENLIHNTQRYVSYFLEPTNKPVGSIVEGSMKRSFYMGGFFTGTRLPHRIYFYM